MTRPDEPPSPLPPDRRWQLSRRRFLQASMVGAGAAAVASAWPGVSSASSPPGSGLLQQLIDSPPFSFTYGGQPSATLLPTWSRSQSAQDLGGGRTQTTVLWTDPASGLQVSWAAIQYAGYQTISWVVQFTNTGSAQTPTLDLVLAADFTMTESQTDWVIHTANGDYNRTTDFSQVDLALAAGSFRTFTNLMGMSTQGYANSEPSAANVGGGWPYYNIDWGNNAGLIVALGWPGQWAVEISRPDSGTLHVLGGMANQDSLGPSDEISAAQLTQLWLAPGESIRTPLIVIQPWTAPNWTDAQNVWRQWVLAYLVPRINGQLPAPICPTQANDYFPDQIDTTNDELTWLNAYGDHQATAGTGGVHDHWWIDAGWYETPANWQQIAPGYPQWEVVGSWTPDPQRFPETPDPSGLKAVSQRAHQLGMSFIVWFEPERVMPGTWLAQDHPDWLLSAPAGYTSFWGPDGSYHLDFGNPDAQQWAIDYFDQFITDHAIDLYREDCNYPFLAYWNNSDPAGRRGITQIRYVTGHLAYWDALRQRHPGMLIDNSAGSGHRLDLELIQRSVSLIQDDVLFNSTANQSQTFSIRYWIPWTGSATRVTGSADDLYNARSNMGLSFHAALDVTSATDNDWATLKQVATEWSSLAGHFYGDYYSLTPYSPASDVWMAWQFNRTDLGTGHIQCFARPDVPASTSLTVYLRGLDPAATYHAWDVDNSGSVSTFTGSQLMAGNADSVGINVAPVPRPYAVTVMYQKV